VRHLALAIAFMVGISACGSAATETTPEPASTGGTGFEAAFTCAELADRWQDLQQNYLDRLGDASSSELEEGSARVDAAGRFIAQAMQEQARDVDLAGCNRELIGDGPLLCTRADRLETAGSAAAEIAETLTTGCTAD
jgi:uncharacterized protein YceK